MAAATREEDAFRRLFRFYRRWEGSDPSGVIDFSKPAGRQVVNCPLKLTSVSDRDAYRAGLHPVTQWKAYGLDNYPGFIYINNPFLPGSQCHWVKQCLKKYTQKPNVCNLDMHMSSEEITDIWEKSKFQLRHPSEIVKVLPESLETVRVWMGRTGFS